MTSLSPFSQLYFDKCKFTGTLVSNPLLPSSHERQTRQSNSSGSRRLNRGSCCTPKFALPFSQEIATLGFSQIFKIGSGIDQIDFSLAADQELGFSLAFLRRNWILRNSINCHMFSHFFEFAERLLVVLKAWLSGIKNRSWDCHLEHLGFLSDPG